VLELGDTISGMNIGQTGPTMLTLINPSIFSLDRVIAMAQ